MHTEYTLQNSRGVEQIMIAKNKERTRKDMDIMFNCKKLEYIQSS